MSKIARFVVWICSKFTRVEIEQIIQGLLDVICNRNPEVKPKDDFKEKHPNYRKFSVDPSPPLTEPPKAFPPVPTKDYKLLLAQYQDTHKKPLPVVRHRSKSLLVPAKSTCPLCAAPHIYIYYNDGRKRSQLKCKVCGCLFQLERRLRKHEKTKYFCPYCRHALYTWKQRREVTIYKCPNDNCLHRLRALNSLNPAERACRKKRSSQFKLCYQYREYHYKPGELKHSSPDRPLVDLKFIHNSPDILGLILTFYVSFAMPARKTAQVLKGVFKVNVSYQTVLNYAAAAAFCCHSFNLAHKGDIDSTTVGDETYIKIMGKNNYVFFFICARSLKITAYHLADNRGAAPAITAMSEAIRTAMPGQKITLITDGNPSYPAGIHFINSLSENNPDIQHRKVIGLQNLDSESEEFRPFKQLIERLNRTYKYHVRPACGFAVSNGAVALTTLFVTHYNFLRPHMSLNHSAPIQLPELKGIATVQGKWAKIVSLTA